MGLLKIIAITDTRRTTESQNEPLSAIPKDNLSFFLENIANLTVVHTEPLIIAGKTPAEPNAQPFNRVISQIKQSGNIKFALEMPQEQSIKNSVFQKLNPYTSENFFIIEKGNETNTSGDLTPYTVIYKFEDKTLSWSTKFPLYISHAAITHEEDVIISGEGFVKKINGDLGDIQWSKQIKTSENNVPEILANPLTDSDNALFIQTMSNPTVVSLATADNTIQWKKKLDGLPLGSFVFKNTLTTVCNSNSKIIIHEINENGKNITSSRIDFYDFFKPRRNNEISFSQKGNTQNIIFLVANYDSDDTIEATLYKYVSNSKSMTRMIKIILDQDTSANRQFNSVKLLSSTKNAWITFPAKPGPSNYTNYRSGILQINLQDPDSCFIRYFNDLDTPKLTNLAINTETQLNFELTNLHETSQISMKNLWQPLTIVEGKYCIPYSDDEQLTGKGIALVVGLAVATLLCCFTILYCASKLVYRTCKSIIQNPENIREFCSCLGEILCFIVACPILILLGGCHENTTNNSNSSNTNYTPARNSDIEMPGRDGLIYGAKYTEIMSNHSDQKISKYYKKAVNNATTQAGLTQIEKWAKEEFKKLEQEEKNRIFY